MAELDELRKGNQNKIAELGVGKNNIWYLSLILQIIGLTLSVVALFIKSKEQVLQ